MTEATIVTAGRRELTRRGAWHVKTLGTVTGRGGIPDVLACHHGRFLAIEFKQPGRHPTPRQVFELDELRQAGAIAIVATSLPDVQQALDWIEAP